jgi:hypothetical protein
MSAERLVRKAVLVLAEEALVDRHRRQHGGRQKEILRPVGERLEGVETREALGEVAHPARQAGCEKPQVDRDQEQEVPELQPVAPLEVGIRAGTALAGDRGQVRVRGRVGIEGGRLRGGEQWQCQEQRAQRERGEANPS